jgi:membrane fusion protein, multidrug efflux system
MKRVIIISLLSTILAIFYGCGAGTDNNTLEQKQKLLTQKEESLKILRAGIAELKEEISKINPEILREERLVTVQEIEPIIFQRFVTLQGSVQAIKIANASSEVGGRIIKLYVKEGDRIKAGQLLATLDMESMERQLQEVEISLELAREVYSKQKSLWDQKIGSEIQYLQAKNNVERLEKSLASIQSQVSKKNVFAPFSGIVEMEMLRAGEVAAPGQGILRIFSDQNLKVVCDLPENYLGKLKKGDLVEIHYPALGVTVRRKVSLIGSTIDATNRTFKAEVEVDNMRGTLKPNLLAQVKIKDLEIMDAIVLPFEIIQEDVNGNKFVFVAEMNDKNQEVAIRRMVKTGEKAENSLVIEDGLTSEDVVIFQGARNVTEGELIKRYQ